MNMKILSLQNLSVTNQRVLLRVDFNVPLQSNGIIVDDTRIRQALTSIEYIISQKGKVILLSHLGRPKGRRVSNLSLAPCAKRLSEISKRSVTLAPDCIGKEVTQLVQKMHPQEIILLENLRFHIEEENPPNRDFASHLAKLGDCYVNDAFASSHRNHSSIVILPTFFQDKSAAGFLMEREIAALSPLSKTPKRPFHIILGGSKVRTKMNILHSLLDKIDSIYLGGSIAFTFLKAQGYGIGSSSCNEGSIQEACELLELFANKMIRLYLPEDILASNSADSQVDIFPSTKMEDGWIGMDIGPATSDSWNAALCCAATIFWNGPLGVWEVPKFAHGTHDLAKAIAKTHATVIIGGGDLTAALNHFRLTQKFSYISTGGAAALEFLQHGHLPGIDALSTI